MPALANGEVAKGFFEAVYAGDFDRAFADYAHPDFVWIVRSHNNPGLETAVPWAGRKLSGKAGYMHLTDQLFSEFEPMSFEARRFAEAGSTVFVEGHFTFRHRKTGRIADSDWLARFDITEGRIAGGSSSRTLMPSPRRGLPPDSRKRRSRQWRWRS